MRSRRDYWRALIEECRGSGLSQAEFCRRRGLSRRSLSFWKWKLSREPGTGAPATVAVPARRPRRPAFVPVRVVSPRTLLGEGPPGAPPGGDGELEIALESGRRVRVWGRVDVQWLGQVLGAVAAARC